jgi:hypothetical protein
MSYVTVQLVREFFELNAFHVMTYWQHDTERARGAEHGLQLFVENTAPTLSSLLDPVLRVGDVRAIPRAVVEVRAWHADRFYPSVIESNPVVLEVAGEESLARARQVFGGEDVRTILVVSELPTSAEPRLRAVSLLQQAGISHVLEFPTILRDILDRINPHVSYAPSHTLQTLRLLKRYDFIRYQQLEFPFPTEAPIAAATPSVDTAEEPEDT